jgi:hypothetical protein
VGLIDFPDPISMFEGIKDEAEKRAMIALGSSIAYSQYITALYMAGKAIEGKPVLGWFSPMLIRMAASTYKMLVLQDSQKLIYTAVPDELARDQKLLDLIHYEKEKQK